MNAITVLRIHNQILGRVRPKATASKMAKLFLTPRNLPLKNWEDELEASCQRVTFSGTLKAAIWGAGDKKVLLMHGWESRATHMYALVEPLVKNGFQVVAIDAPKHGQSGGDKANLVAFSEAIVAADVALGPFVAAVGHSLGGAALTYAIELGAQVNCCVLISSPACILDVLQGFSRFVGLPIKTEKRFIEYIERETGVPAHELDMGRILSEKKIKTLLVHSQDDLEISVQALNKIHLAWPQSETYIAENLGHRNIIRDADIATRVQQFVQNHHSLSLLKHEVS
ncbi:alpha/beta hydrolase [Pseudomonas sp. HK3]|jgi:pimeloyl-ACP methyl ester carboxylesterase